MTALQILAGVWIAGMLAIWFVAIGVSFDRSGDGGRGADPLVLAIGFGAGIAWPAVLAGCGGGYAVYRIGRRRRRGA